MTFAIDLSNLPAILSALGSNLQLALVTSDGVTWTAALVQQGQPAFVYQGAGNDPGSAVSALQTAISGQASTDAAAATTRATAVAAAVKSNAVQPGGGAIKTQGAT